jgi:periplasmic divalent cation tolerance protein
MIFIYTTCKDKKEARKIGEVLVKEKLAACVNYFPIDSIYKWQDKLVKDKEFALLIKAIKKNFKKIKKRIKELHSYEVTCIIGCSITRRSRDYFNWVKRQTK